MYLLCIGLWLALSSERVSATPNLITQNNHKMKYSIIALCLGIAACSPNTSPTPPANPTPTNPNPQPVVNAHFIPNWYNNDTLYATTLDQFNNANGIDTIITINRNDTSLIKHKGHIYYIWTEPMSAVDTFKNNQMQYGNCIISLTTNKVDAVSKSLLNTAIPYKYKDQQGNWSYKKQGIGINDQNTTFPKTNLGAYMSNRQYH